MNRPNAMVSFLFGTAVVFGSASTAFAKHVPNEAKAEHFVKFSTQGEPNEPASTSEAKTGKVTVNGGLYVTGALRVNGSARVPTLVVSQDLTVKGSATLQQLTVPSSRRWKYDISGLAGPDALALLEGLKPVAFKLKGDRSGVSHLGFVAEEMPTALAGPDGQTYRPFEVIAVLTKALQEQQTMIRALRERVTTLGAAADRY